MRTTSERSRLRRHFFLLLCVSAVSQYHAPDGTYFPTKVADTRLSGNGRTAKNIFLGSHEQATRLSVPNQELRLTNFIINEQMKPRHAAGQDFVFYDIGAALGWTAVHAAAVSRVVVAFETDRAYLGALTQNLNVNNVKNARVVRWQPSSRSGTMENFAKMGYAASYHANRQIQKGSSPARPRYRATVKRLDDAFKSGELKDYPDVVRLDLEGAEMAALVGMNSLLRTHPPSALLIATYAPSEHRILSYMQCLGYVAYQYVGEPGAETLAPVSISAEGTHHSSETHNIFVDYLQRQAEYEEAQRTGALVHSTAFLFLMSVHKPDCPITFSDALNGIDGHIASLGGPPLPDLSALEIDENQRTRWNERGMGKLLRLVTAASSDYYDALANLIGSVHTQDYRMKIVVFDLGLTVEQRLQVQCWLNVEYRLFDFERYPPHVRTLGTYAWKPLVVQEALQEFQHILYMDATYEARQKMFQMGSLIEARGHLFVSDGCNTCDLPDVACDSKSPCTVGESLTPGFVSELLGLKNDDEYVFSHKPCISSSFVGFHIQGGGGHAAATQVLHACVRCALNPRCLFPANSNRFGHNFADACFSVLVHQVGLLYETDRWFNAAGASHALFVEEDQIDADVRPPFYRRGRTDHLPFRRAVAPNQDLCANGPPEDNGGVHSVQQVSETGLVLTFPGSDWSLSPHLLGTHGVSIHFSRPSLHKLSPPTNYVAGGNVVTVEGSGFTVHSHCVFGVVVAQTQYVSPTQLLCIAPPSPFRDHGHFIGEKFRGLLFRSRVGFDEIPLIGGYVEVAVVNHYLRSPESLRYTYYVGSIEAGDTVTEARKKTDGDAVQRMFHAHQSPPSCSTAEVLTLELPRTGAGAQIMLISTAFMEAMAQNRILLLVGEWSYAPGCAEGFHCWFEPFSHCKLSDFAPSRVRAYQGYIEKDLFEEHMHYVPQQYHSHGWSWWRAQTLRFIVRPKQFMMDHIQHVKQVIGWTPNIVGIHIRRGERGRDGHGNCLETYPMFDIEDCMVLVGELQRRYGVSTVFLATDAIDMLKASDRFQPDVKVIHNSFFERPQEGRDCLREGNVGCDTHINATEITLNVITDWVLLSESPYFVGTLSSTYTRLPFLLGYGHGRNKTQFLSLE